MEKKYEHPKNRWVHEFKVKYKPKTPAEWRKRHTERLRQLEVIGSEIVGKKMWVGNE